MNYVIEKADLPNWLDLLCKKARVVVPAENDLGASCFQEFKGQQLFLEARTDFSPRKFLLPAVEKMFFFRKKNFSYRIEPLGSKEPTILFGVRPCDTHALHALDELFIRFLGEDQYYSTRRKNTVLIALLCNKPCSNGFCTSMGTSRPVDHDILFAERETDFVVSPVSEKGKNLLHKNFFKQTKDPLPEQQLNCEKELLTEDIEDNLYNNFNHPVWKQESERCLSCTACTQVCPTCYCYSSDDCFEFGSANSERARFRDSCQLQRFSEIAGGHVFRKSRESRLRQFVLHKLSYYKKHHNLQLCIGCGRCIDTCPVKIDLTEIANTIQREALK